MKDKPIYPTNAIYPENQGVTLREHYAGLAMQSLLLNDYFNGVSYANRAKEAVKCADALIAALEKSNP